MNKYKLFNNTSYIAIHAAGIPYSFEKLVKAQRDGTVSVNNYENLYMVNEVHWDRHVILIPDIKGNADEMIYNTLHNLQYPPDGYLESIGIREHK